MRLPTLPRPAPTLCTGCSARSPVSPESCIAECMHATRLQLCSSPASRLLLACYSPASGAYICIRACVARLCRPVVLLLVPCLCRSWVFGSLCMVCGLRSAARRSGPFFLRLLPAPQKRIGHTIVSWGEGQQKLVTWQASTAGPLGGYPD